jgi:hypothetical protein
MVDSAVTDRDNMFHKSALYQEFLAERAEILRHKWIESEKAGYDIGFEKALLDWIVKHRAGWRALRQQKPSSSSSEPNVQKDLQPA